MWPRRCRQKIHVPLLQKTLPAKRESRSSPSNTYWRATVCLRHLQQGLFHLFESKETYSKCSQVCYLLQINVLFNFVEVRGHSAAISAGSDSDNRQISIDTFESNITLTEMPTMRSAAPLRAIKFFLYPDWPGPSAAHCLPILLQRWIQPCPNFPDCKIWSRSSSASRSSRLKIEKLPPRNQKVLRKMKTTKTNSILKNN